jgi:hypothetical protein
MAHTHTLSDRADLRKLDPAVAPVTTGLGVLGMPGFTAYAGLRVIGKPVPWETVVVAAASGLDGSRKDFPESFGRPRDQRRRTTVNEHLVLLESDRRLVG